MLIRIVKMEFKKEYISDFKILFNQAYPEIIKFDGCMSVQLMKDPENEFVYFTYSKWENESSLENYRNSEFFLATWRKTKILFSEKAIAFSMIDGN